MYTRRALVTAAALMILPVAATAHHGWSSFDDKKGFNVTGTISETRWQNPHATVKISAGSDTWTVDLAPIGRMEARGLKADDLKNGGSAEVMGYPHRTEKGLMRAEWIKVDGKTVQLR